MNKKPLSTWSVLGIDKSGGPNGPPPRVDMKLEGFGGAEALGKMVFEGFPHALADA